MIRFRHLLAFAFFALSIGTNSVAIADIAEEINADPPAGPASVSGTYYATGTDRYIFTYIHSYDPATNTVGAQVGPMLQQGPVMRGAGNWTQNLGNLPSGSYYLEILLVSPNGLTVTVRASCTTIITVP